MPMDESDGRADSSEAMCEELDRARRRIAELEGQLEALRRSERQTAELARALQESEERYRILVDTCPDSITVTDLEGKLLMTNQQGAIARGYDSPEEVVAAGRDAFQLIAPEDRQRAYDNAKKTLETGGIRSIEYCLVDRHGVRKPVEMNVSLIKDTQGVPKAFIGVTRDITERKRAEAERERLHAQVLHTQKLESLGVLAGGIAHDFNNLLVGILGSASLALHTTAADGESSLRALLGQIETAAVRARELTEQLLAYAGKAQIDVQPLDLGVLLEEMTELLSLSVSKKARIDSELAPELPAVEGDPTQLRQVVMNLITNASEALSEESGTITVRTSTVEVGTSKPGHFVAGEPRPGRYVVLEVADTGCGMDSQVAGKLFDPFFTTKFTGRGLGLSAVLGIVRAHQGAIALNSAPGQGTTIRILLPAAGPPCARTRAPAVEDRPKGAADGTLLVVDDEPAVRTILEGMLTSVGYRVVQAEDGAQAVACFAKEPSRYAAVVLDATMPHLDGGETSRELRKIRADIRIVFSSGFTQADVAERIQLGKHDAFVQKPYRMPTLLAVIERVLSS